MTFGQVGPAIVTLIMDISLVDILTILGEQMLQIM